MKRLAIVFIMVAAGAATNGADAETCGLTLYSGSIDAIDSGSSWTGPCSDDKAHGEGEAQLGNATYEGHAEDGFAHGLGVLKFDDGASYDGAWSKGKFHGYGTLIDPDGDKHAGHWRAGQPHGEGARTNADGTTVRGRWSDGVLVEKFESQDDSRTAAADRDQAMETAAASCKVQVFDELLDWSGSCTGALATRTGEGRSAQGVSYGGTAVDGKAHGQGTVVTSANVRYEGAWLSGLPHGRVTMTWPGGGYHQGEFVNGKRHGKATFRHSDGQMYIARFEDDQMVGEMTPTESVASEPGESAANTLSWDEVLNEKSAVSVEPVDRESAATAEPETWDDFYEDTGTSEDTASPLPDDDGEEGASSAADFGDGTSDYEYGLQDLEKREAAAVRAKRNREKHEQQKADFLAREKLKREEHEKDWWEAERAGNQAQERDALPEPADSSEPVDDSVERAREQAQERAESSRRMFEESQRQLDRSLQMLRQTQKQQRRAYESDTARDALRQAQDLLRQERDLRRIREQQARERQTYEPVGQGGERSEWDLLWVCKNRPDRCSDQ